MNRIDLTHKKIKEDIDNAGKKPKLNIDDKINLSKLIQ